MSNYLFNSLDGIRERIAGKRISIFLDYDGTLTPIVSRPEKALLPYQMKEIIRGLCRICRVAIVSGREMSDIKDKVGVRECVYVGNHGMEIEGKGITFEMKGAAQARGTLNRFLEEIGEAVREANIRGIVLEDKRLTVSIHYRLLDKRDVEPFLSLTRSALEPYLDKGLFRAIYGKKVVEVRPGLLWDKGKAVRWILNREEFRGTLPVYIGDDETDRDAFRELKGEGISIAVGPLLEDADFYMRSQGEVKKFLSSLQSLMTG